LRGKTILITGGRRIGQVVADTVGAAGAQVVMTYKKHREEIAQAVDHLAELHGIRTGAYELDLTDEGSITALVRTVGKDFGGIDGLVNMASVFEPDPPKIAVSHVLKAFSVSIGSILLSRMFAEEAQRRKAQGAPIVSFIDWAVDHPYAQHDLYLAGKAALRHYLMALQTTFAGTIRVVNIHPGMILEPKDFPAKEKQEIVQNTPTRSTGDPQQAARLVRLALETDFLADNIRLDGGQHWRHRL
ncbi:MAG: short-chain dehydrogenase/reductase SDR, partial [Parcubacteria group bacterium Gr01-1014_106]